MWGISRQSINFCEFIRLEGCLMVNNVDQKAKLITYFLKDLNHVLSPFYFLALFRYDSSK